VGLERIAQGSRGHEATTRTPEQRHAIGIAKRANFETVRGLL